MTAPPVAFVCPQCRSELEGLTDAWQCRPCGGRYDVPCRIPDFRVAPDPWIGIDDDRAKGARLDAAVANASFEAAVRAYWRMTPETPAELVERFVAHVLAAPRRSREWLQEGAVPPAGPWLDLGCGTADLAAAAPDPVAVMSVDVAFRWLIAARKRLSEAGRPEYLACCNAETLPFPDRSFAQVVSLGMLEHTADPAAVFREARRVLQSGGLLRLRTVNRYSLLREPHVNVWGVGFVPRRLAHPYVRMVSGRDYRHHRPCSPREIRQELRRAGFTDVRVDAARLLASEAEKFESHGLAVSLYRTVQRHPAGARAAAWVVPLLDVCATAP